MNFLSKNDREFLNSTSVKVVLMFMGVAILLIGICLIGQKWVAM